MSIRSFDFYIVFFMVLLAIYSGAMFYGERPEFIRSDKDIIAVLDLRENTVKIKPVNTVAWVDALSGDKLAPMDQIYTHQDSEAKINFDDGPLVELSENTLFKIEKAGDKTLLKLERGVMQASLSKNSSDTLINISGENLTLSSSNARFLVVKEKGKSKIAILDGSLSVKSKKKELRISKDEVLEVDHKTSSRRVFKSNVSLVSPIFNAKIRSNPVGETLFKWKGDADQYRFQLSKDLDFKNVLYEELVSASEVSISSRFDGRVYWRVSSGEKANWSIPSRVFFIKSQTPDLIFPRNGEVAKRVDPLDHEEQYIVLRWKDLGDVKYHVNLTDPNGAHSVYERESPSFVLDGLLAGNYKVRIDVTDDVGRYRGVDSQFQIEEQLSLVRPTLISPKDGAKQTLFQKEGVGIKFVWHAPVLGQSHEIQIKDSDDRVISSKTVSSSSYTWSTNLFGRYSWRVRTVSKTDKSEFTSWRKFSLDYVEIGNKYPEQGTKLKLSRPNQKVKFQWDQVATQSSIYELSKDKSFSTIIHKKVLKSNFVNVSFPEIGVYYWRTRILDSKGNVSYSRPVKVLVSPTPPPTAPKIFDNQSIEINLIKMDSHSLLLKLIDLLFPSAYAAELRKVAVIRWPKSSSASKYLLEVYRDREMKEKILKRTLDSNYFEFVEPEPGTYFWRIAIIDHWERQSPFSNLAKFNLVLSDKLTALSSTSLIFPAHKVQVPFRQSYVQPFQWEADTRATKFKLEVAHDLAFKRVVATKITKRPKARLKLQSLKLGSPLFWRVTSYGKYGQVNVSKRRSLLVINRESAVVKALPVESFKSRSYYGFGYSPYSLDYLYTGEDSDVELSGFSILSLNGRGNYEFAEDSWVTLWASASKNSAFKQDHNTYELKAGYDRSYNGNVKYGAGVHYSAVTVYSGGLIDSTTLSPESLSFIAPYFSGSITYQYRKRFSFEIAGAYTLVGFNSLYLGAGAFYRLEQGARVGLSPFYISESFESNATELKQSKLGINFSIDFNRN